MWEEYIKYIMNLKEKYIGKKVMYENEIYNIVDVDVNGIIHIDKPTKYNKTSAVYFPYEADKNIIQK